MNDRDLAYWIQGAFEIGGISAISDAQAAVILRHVALVRVIDPTSVFASQVDAVVRNVKEPGARADTLRPVVAGLFLHVIDPGHPNPKAADAAHGHLTESPFGPVYRC
jgi:hypothetical protein